MDAIDEFIKKQIPKNTTYGTNTAHRLLVRFLNSIGETRDVLSFPQVELDGLLCRFIIEVRKLNGDNFEPDSLSTIHKNLQRYLFENNYSGNILKEVIFDKSRQVLAAKRKELTKLGHGNKPHATRELSKEEVDMLFNEGYFGRENAQSLLNAVWWFCSLHFGYRARHEARRLCWGDIALKFDETLQIEFLEWEKERGSKTRTGKEHETKRAFSPTIYATGGQNCPISI
jgi:hypothetical protein